MQIETIYLSAMGDAGFDAAVQSLGAAFLGSTQVQTRRAYLEALARAVERSDAIIASGELFGPAGLVEITGKGLGMELEPINWSALGLLQGSDAARLPKGAIPLVTKGGEVGGAVLESGGQSLVLITGDMGLRGELFDLYVRPYLLAKADEAPVAESTQPEPEPQTPVPAVPAQPEEVQPALDDAAILADLHLDEEQAEDEPEENAPSAKKPASRAKRLLLRVFLPILIIALLASGGYFGYEFWYIPKQCDDAYAQAREDYGQSGENTLPADVLLKFGKLYEQNPDLIGWVRQKEAGLDYPVVSAAAQPSGYYAQHLFDGTKNKFGTPYMNGEFDSYILLQNMVVYGANYQDGRMFAGLEQYLGLEFYKSAPTISLDTLYEEAAWKIFGVLLIEKDVEAAGFNYKASNFFNDDAVQQYIDEVQRRSAINCGVDVAPTDKMLTLVTQYSKDSRMNVVIVARKTRLDENEAVDTASATLNAGVQVPELWKMRYNPRGTESVAAQFLSDVTASRVSSEELSSSQTQGVSTGLSGVSGWMSTAPLPAPVSSAEEKPAASAAQGSSSKGGSSSAAAVKPPVVSSVPSGNANAQGVKFWVKNGTQIVCGDAVEIVARVVEAEMGSGFEYEALKAQAVATYSYLMYQGADKESSNPPSVPMKTASDKALRATREVCGQRIYYNGKPCSILYFAMSAGKTANAADLWSGAAHLVSVDSPIESSYSNFETKVTYSASDVKKWVAQEYDVDLGTVSDKTKWFQVTYDSNNLYAKEVSLGGKITVRGHKLRESLFTAARVGSSNMLRSHAYRISYDKESDSFTFTVRGYGHGVGMSQVGAHLYAQQGWNYLQILTHYYTGVTVK